MDEYVAPLKSLPHMRKKHLWWFKYFRFTWDKERIEEVKETKVA